DPEGGRVDDDACRGIDGAGDRAEDLVPEACADAARREREIAASVDLTRAAAARTGRVAGALDRGVVGATAILDVPGVRVGVGDRPGERADAAGLLGVLAAGARHRHLGARNDLLVVRRSGPADVEERLRVARVGDEVEVAGATTEAAGAILETVTRVLADLIGGG